MKRISMFASLVIALALVSAMTATASQRARVATAARVQLKRTRLGLVIANGRGFTLYVFTRDTRDHNRCRTVSGCSGIWPSLKTNGRPLAGAGVRRALLGTIRLSGSVTQVTYAGRPLYGYIGNSAPGQTGYVGASQFGGRWYAINANGRLVK